MIVKLAINGLGRIGRLALRQLVECPGVEIVGLNDPADTKTLGHLVKYDSVHRAAPFPVSRDGDALLLDGRRIPVFHQEDPALLPFGDLGARVVLECAETPTDRAAAARHLRGSVGHVLVSAPSRDADITVAMGVNHERIDPARHRVIGAAGGTANCLAPMVKVLDEPFGLECGLVTAVHSYTNDQRILDLPHRDLRRARAASMSMIPTATGAIETVGLVFPHLAGRLDGLAVRVPAPGVSLVDLSAMLAREATAADIHRAFREASAGPLGPWLEIVEDEIVGVDLTGHTASCIFDPFLTKVMTPRYVKVFGWYDSESGCAARLRDLALCLLDRMGEGSR